MVMLIRFAAELNLKAALGFLLRRNEKIIYTVSLPKVIDVLRFSK